MAAYKFSFLELDIDVRQWDLIEVAATIVLPESIAPYVPGSIAGPHGRISLGATTLSFGKPSWTIRIDPVNFLVGYLEYSVTLSLDLDAAVVVIEARLDARLLNRSLKGFPQIVQKRWGYAWPKAPVLKIGNADIAHVVVVMLENRSLDDVLGWLYEDSQNRPPLNIPPQDPPTYAGLVANRYWCPRDRADLNVPDDKVPEDRRVYATKGTSKPNIPDPDPCEQFRHMNFQLFGKDDPLQPPPPPFPEPTMKGFVVDYAAAIEEAKAKGADARTIMQTYAPGQMPVLTALARNYAVCDRWFASVPCQTWPNRAFVHAGTSCGRVNNLDTDTDSNRPPDPWYYDTRTIFNVMLDAGVTWKVYGDSPLPTLTRYQFLTQLYDPWLNGHFRGLAEFKQDASNGTLPSYCFVEPDFMLKKNDAHPPHDVPLADAFLYQVWQAVRNGPGWKNTLMIITCDEHGGCYDHVPPPWTAVKPDASPPQKPFGFNRYGVRVPTVVVSPWVERGAVFRARADGAPAGVEFDHTSILATLRDWQGLAKKPKVEWLKSERIKTAPTLASVLTCTAARTDTPDVPVPAPLPVPAPVDVPLNVLQRSIVAATFLEMKLGKPTRADFERIAGIVEKIDTVADAIAKIRDGKPILLSARAPVAPRRKQAVKSKPKPKLKPKPKKKSR